MIGEEKSYLQFILQKMTGFCHKLMHCMSSRLYFLRAYEKKLEQEYQNSSKKE